MRGELSRPTQPRASTTPTPVPLHKHKVLISFHFYLSYCHSAQHKAYELIPAACVWCHTWWWWAWPLQWRGCRGMQWLERRTDPALRKLWWLPRWDLEESRASVKMEHVDVSVPWGHLQLNPITVQCLWPLSLWCMMKTLTLLPLQCPT